ncbi:hypothetical protein [Pseudomarimonas arenosa]|uniref:Uncharacterized protein n=1 Tax=Pseudomarimonas arenosa TaxID=2774145 RepID=A0AAW3ZHC7_9GAMM|nr:hypothetical protein [Pseudomarimonas arenosa]MBD8524122.1 hypothetical protein [Pseudomarimonas arenosa]
MKTLQISIVGIASILMIVGITLMTCAGILAVSRYGHMFPMVKETVHRNKGVEADATEYALESGGPRIVIVDPPEVVKPIPTASATGGTAWGRNSVARENGGTAWGHNSH